MDARGWLGKLGKLKLLFGNVHNMRAGSNKTAEGRRRKSSLIRRHFGSRSRSHEAVRQSPAIQVFQCSLLVSRGLAARLFSKGLECVLEL